MIIKSLLDQDFYKFSMGQVVLNSFPDFMVKYQFKCRNKGIVWTDAMLKEIREELKAFCTLHLNEDELSFLKSIRFLKSYYVDFLRLYKADFNYLKIWCDDELHIEIEGPWFLTIYFEMPILSIVNEVYFRHTTDSKKITENGKEKLKAKIDIALCEKFRFSEFGTRRRYSLEWHDLVIRELSENLPSDILTGTSNVYFAYKYNLTPIGTMAHEFIQAGQASDGVTLANSQQYMLQKWVDIYRGDLGIALTDTLGMDKFLKDFDLYFAKLYDGVRHDSGDPFEWAEKMLNHYKNLHIDPKTKSLVFSDGLDFKKAALLWKKLKDEAHIVFGIGTNLTNDFDGVTPLQIVVKMVQCNGKPVAKLSDSAGKTMCTDDNYLRYLRSVI
jgi:nicotinate phosphoribosyltransferase